MRKLLVIVVLFCLPGKTFSGFGVEREILFKNIANKDGLSQSTVFKIVQDTIGYMWFATQDGLNRYDGYDFKVYRNDEENPASISSNYLRALKVDSNGTLWIGGNKGISRYDFIHDSFQNYQLFDTHPDRYVSDIEEDDGGCLWAGTFNGNLYQYNLDKNEFREIKPAYNGEKLDYINDLLSFEDNLIIGTEYGLFSMDKNNLSIRYISLSEQKSKIRALKRNIRGGFWVGTEGEGLFLLNDDLTVQQNILHDINNSNSLCNNNVRSLEYDNEGHLWIGTFVGLSIYNQEQETFSNHYENFSKPYSLSQNSVRSILRDKQGGMWLGTFFGGVNYYHPANIKFNLLNQNASELSLSDDVVSSIVEGKNGNIWISTNDKGLNLWDRENGIIKSYTYNEKIRSSLSSNNLKGLLLLNNGKLLIGTHRSGLNFFDPKRNKSIIFKHDEKNLASISGNSVYALLQDHKKQIWVGTWSGLDRFDLESGKFDHFYSDSKGRRLSSDQISFLFEDSRNRIWVGTFDGLNIFYPERNMFESFKKKQGDISSLSDNEIMCVTEDSKGRIWIGTKNGLNVFDEIERGFKRFTTKDGLPNNVIYGIVEDDKDCLWISTNKGLSCFHQQTRKFRNYDTGDGLQSRQFNNYSFCKLSDGKIMFGGINGITIFNPENIKETPFNTDVVLTQLRIFYKNVLPGDHNKVLEKHIGQTREIKLKSNQNVFAFNFIAINYIASQKIKYLIKLENYDKEWRLSSDTRSGTYSNLPFGKYTFKVKAVSGEGVVNDKVTSIDVHILKPWWLSFWAILVYVFLFIILAVMAYRLIRERIKTQNDLRVERLEKEKLKEINQMKLQFFTNISHEFRTPLTLILSPLEKILEKRLPDEWLNKQHDLIYKNTRRLLNLINQLMDFRKSEIGKLKVKASKGDFVGAINEIYLSFASVASQNNIVYTFDAKDERMEMYFDPGIIEKILFNLLSNAFKFTPNGGTVGIQLYKAGKWAVLEISDTGKGIASDKLSLIFERFYRIDENAENPGSGIGLALVKRLVEIHHGNIELESTEGKGSRFKVYLPLSEKEFTEDELFLDEPVKEITPENPDIIFEDSLINEFDGADKEELDSLLIVEDNKDIINYLKENLSHKYKIYSAPNGEEALKLVGEKQPSLIISDIMMPVMDGIKFCRKIKQNIKTCHIPVLLLTAKSLVEEQIEGIESGADDYVPKPFSMNLLETKVNTIIKNRKRLKEYYSKALDIQPEKIAFNLLDEELIAKAKKVVEDHLTEADFSVDIFAREMGMSRSSLHLKLKAITGESATDFIKKIRFGKAVILIEENRYSISEICYMVGFNSPSYFSTSFKKYFGYLPTEHLQKLKDKM